jgi:anti-sigma factor RsiW
MKPDGTRPDDDALSAWLDGELEPAERASVSAWLSDHPEDAARVRLWQADRDALRARLAGALNEPLRTEWVDRLRSPAALAGTRAANAAQWQRAAWAAGLVLASGLGGAWLNRHWPADGGTGPLVAQAPSTPPAAWLQRAAAAHAVYVPEQRHPVEVSVREGNAEAQKAQEQHLARWLTKRLDLPVRLFDLRAQGFELVGGRLLPDAPGPGAQLMYQDGTGQRVTVYLRRPESRTPASFRFEQVEGLGLFYWVEGTAGYALVGALPRERLLTLAESLYAQGAAEAGPPGDGVPH